MSENTNTAYADAIKYLETSPMFNLSLSSKELFHSNFLYWISTIDKNKSIFKGLVESLGANVCAWIDNEWVVKREFKNLDVCVIDKKGKILLVVENKVKSIPTTEQLELYNHTIEENNKGCQDDKVHKVLLSLTKPNFDSKDCEWTWVGYDKIIEYLTNLTKDLNKYKDYKEKAPYYNQIIIDYTDFISAMLTVVAEWELNDFKLEVPYLLNYKSKEDVVEADVDCADYQLRASDRYKTAEKLRIHDLYGKYRTAILCEELKKLLSEKLKNLLKDIPADKIEVKYGYSNATPLLEVKIKGVGEKIKDQLEEVFCIQIQGKQYRHAIWAKYQDATNRESRIEQSTTRIKDQYYKGKWKWFMDINHKPNNENNQCFPRSIFDNKKFKPVGQRKQYCAYDDKTGGEFIYQYVTIQKEATAQDVLNAIVEDVRNILEQLKKQQ